MNSVRDFKALRYLNLSKSGVVGESLTGSLESCHTLEEVVLDHCQALDNVCLRMGALKVGRREDVGHEGSSRNMSVSCHHSSLIYDWKCT